MKLFQTSDGEMSEIEREPFKLEKEIQTLVEKNLEAIFGIQFVSTEFAVEKFRIDTLAFDEQSNSFVIIEYKRGSSYSVIDQGYSYLSVMLNNKAEFILEYNESCDSTLKRNDVDWSSSRVLFVSPSFNAYQRNSVNFRDVPFELWEIRRFSNSIVALERIESSSSESIESVSATTTDSVIANVSKEVKSYSIDDQLAHMDIEYRNLWEILRESLSDFTDATLVAKKGSVNLIRESTAVCYIQFRKKELRVEILRGNRRPDGDESKGFFTLDDPKTLAKERSWKWKSGTTGHVYIIKFAKPEQIEYVSYLLKQKYESLG